MFSQEEILFLTKNKHEDPNKLRLKYASKTELDYNSLINQIETRKKAKTKLPSLYKNVNFIFPPASNLEQSSSEITAKYKCKILSGKKGIDLTGGFGIDTIFMSESFESYTHVEPNSKLQNITKENFKSLNLTINSVNLTCEEFLKINKEQFDAIYLDPSRKNDGNKTVFLEDYLPNVVELQDELNKIGKKILIKTSPLLDIKNTIQKLKSITEIHIISIKNEVKEVLYLIDSESKKNIIFKTINFKNDSEFEEVEFILEKLNNSKPSFSDPLKYIYEPNSSIMKSGAFNFISEHFNINKLHQNSHLYSSKELIKDFPGRSFELVETVNYNKKELKKFYKANISTRNFPNSVEEIRKKTKIKDGGDIYLFATTLINEKPVILVCSKIEN